MTLTAFLFVVLADTSAFAQAIAGTVLDRDSRSPVAGVALTIRSADGETVASVASDERGSFVVRLTGADTYVIEATRIGYEAARSDTVPIAAGEIVTVTLLLSARPVSLPALTVTARSRALHDASYDGLYARRLLTPAVGTTHIWVKADREFEAVIKPSDFLRLVKPRRIITTRTGQQWACTPFLFRQGFLVRDTSAINAYLDGFADDLEGIEVFEDYTSVPLEYRTELSRDRRFRNPSDARDCLVVAIWMRRPDYPKR